MNWRETREALIKINPDYSSLPEVLGYRVFLRGAFLEGANLRGACLQGVYLRGAFLYGADLWDANLRGACLGWADLRGADLRGADLREADFMSADLRGADLRGVRLDWTSHEILSELLWRKATQPDQEMLAAWVGRKTEWCWEEWLQVDHPERKWALDVLQEYVNDDSPDILIEAIRERK